MWPPQSVGKEEGTWTNLRPVVRYSWYPGSDVQKVQLVPRTSCSEGTVGTLDQMVPWTSCSEGTVGTLDQKFRRYGWYPGPGVLKVQLVPWTRCSEGTVGTLDQMF